MSQILSVLIWGNNSTYLIENETSWEFLKYLEQTHLELAHGKCSITISTCLCKCCQTPVRNLPGNLCLSNFLSPPLLVVLIALWCEPEIVEYGSWFFSQPQIYHNPAVFGVHVDDPANALHLHTGINNSPSLSSVLLPAAAPPVKS